MKINHLGLQIAVVLGAGFIVLAGVVPARANLKEIKNYKEAFPDVKLKCIDCHVDEKPKKDEGRHDNNDYGKAVLDAVATPGEKPTAETFKKVGSIEDFAKKAKTQTGETDKKN